MKKKRNVLVQTPLTEASAENKVPEAFPTVSPVLDVRTFNALQMSFESFWSFCFLAASSTLSASLVLFFVAAVLALAAWQHSEEGVDIFMMMFVVLCSGVKIKVELWFLFAWVRNTMTVCWKYWKYKT